MSKLAAIYGTTTELVDDWRERAACVGNDPELWFSSQAADVSVALGICGRCPVRLECMDDSARVGDKYGVWGGVVKHEVRTHRDSPIKHGTTTGYRQHHERQQTPPCQPCLDADAERKRLARERKRLDRESAS